MTLTDYIREEKKKEEDLPALKTVLTHRYNDLKITYESTEEDWLQTLEKYWRLEDEQKLNNEKTKVGRKNSMDALSD